MTRDEIAVIAEEERLAKMFQDMMDIQAELDDYETDCDCGYNDCDF